MNDLNLDTKAINKEEQALAYDTMMRAHDAFKETNDVKQKDILVEEKLNRINETLDKHQQMLTKTALQAQRPAFDTKPYAPSNQEHKQAFDSYVRHGETQGLKSLETRAMSVSVGADGGYLVPSEVENSINRALSALSPIRGISNVRQISAMVYKRPFLANGFATGWVGETATRPQTNNTAIDEQSFTSMELYAMPAATQALLDDNVVNLESWIASEVETVFAEQENQAFVNGNGTTAPKGFLSYPTLANAAWANGSLGYIASGAAAGFATTTPSDKLMDLIYALKAPYRQNATFVMNRKTQAEIRKFKDTQNNYIWQPPAVAGGQAQLMGMPLTEVEAMPDIAANSLPIAYGDFKRGYLIVDRAGVRILRDPYSAKPYVLFYTTKRVGGGVTDFDAIKVMKIAAA